MQSSAARKPNNHEYAEQCCTFLPQATYEQALAVYHEMLNDPNLDDYVLAQVGRCDRFFLLAQILRRADAYNPWLYERCREVESNPDGCLDLWSREHYKSTIITFAGSIQEIINDVEISIGLFSHTRPIAKAFLNQIKQECEINPLLPRLYPDVFWELPRKDAPSWSLDGGIVFKRKSVSNMASIEAWGLVDSQPTSKHFKLMIYDDVVTLASVTTAEMIVKTTEAWELSRHLASKDGAQVKPRTWHIGTRYNYADTYRVILDRDVLTPRIYPATADGTMDGKPVFLTQAQWDEKKKESSPYTIACQMLQNPIAGSEQEFLPEWLRKYELRPYHLNVFILVDPANSKKKESSNTAFAVVGMDQQRNKYLLDGAYHKMSLPERWTMLKGLYFKWVRAKGVQVVTIGYERYGMQADIEHFKEMMQIEKCPFPIEEVNWAREGGQAKDDRIRRLIPDHKNWRFFYPYEGELTRSQAEAQDLGKGYLVSRSIKRKDENGRLYNLVEKFVSNEYLFFPATTAKDFMDAMSRFYDLDVGPPMVVNDEDIYPELEED